MELSLHAKGLACRRGGRILFAGLDLHVRKGGALIISGPNGTGKTSLLRIVAGLSPPWSGTVCWGEMGARHNLRHVGHQDGVKARASIFADITHWARLGGLHGADISRRGLEALDAMGLAGLAASEGRILSAGQRKRLALARLLLAPPPAAWLLDEPVTGLDHDGRSRFAAQIERHRATGGIVIMTAHDDFHADGVERIELSAYHPG